MAKSNRYQALILKIFLDRYRADLNSFEFERIALEECAKELDI